MFFGTSLCTLDTLTQPHSGALQAGLCRRDTGNFIRAEPMCPQRREGRAESGLNYMLLLLLSPLVIPLVRKL